MYASTREVELQDANMSEQDWNSRSACASTSEDGEPFMSRLRKVYKPRLPRYKVGKHRRDAVDEARTTFIFASLSKLRSSGKFADLAIRCGGRDFDAHRVVVCSQSSFFDNAVADWALVGLSPRCRRLGT
jgi:hypothetical protein